MIKIANQCLLFLPTSEYSQEIRALKIKITSTLKRAIRLAAMC